MKTKSTPRARRMWANYYPKIVCVHHTRKSAGANSIPVAVIPLDDPEALVDAAVASHSHSYCGIATRRQAMRAALIAIGVLPKQRKGGAK